MKKTKFIMPAFLLVALVLVGGSCAEDLSFGLLDEDMISLDEIGYDEDGNRLVLPEPELECWPIGSEIGPWDASEEKTTNVFGTKVLNKCKSLECKTPEGMEWMTVVNYFEDKMIPLGWEKDSYQNIYWYEWQTFTIWYQGYNKKNQQGYELEYCDLIPLKDLE